MKKNRLGLLTALLCVGILGYFGVTMVFSKHEGIAYQHIVTYGQSLSRGGGAPDILSNKPKYNNRMFRYADGTGGVIYYRQDYIDFMPLVESERETPATSTVNYYSELLNKENGVEKRNLPYLIGSAPGYGGLSLAELDRGTKHYSQMLYEVQSGTRIASSKGSSYSVSAMTWTQGESDVGCTREQYKKALGALKNNVIEDVMEITDQKNKPIFVTYQLASHRRYIEWVGSKNSLGVALGLLDASEEDEDIYLATPMYQMEYDPDNVHITSEGSVMLGHYYGLVLKKILSDKEDWKPLSPTEIVWKPRSIDIEFHVPFGKLVFDTSWVKKTENFGFDVWSPSGQILDIIDSVEIISPSHIQIALSKVPPEGARLTYAKGRDEDINGANRICGARGNLRDTQGDKYFYVGADGIRRRLDNWCVIFDSRFKM